MTWIMAYALSNKMANTVQTFLNSHPEVVVAKINWQLWFLKNNGEVLAFLSKLKKENSEHMEFYVIDPLSPDLLPEKIKLVVDYAIKNKCDIADAVEKLQSEIENLEDLRTCQIKYERMW
jgi:hypothetical protein